MSLRNSFSGHVVWSDVPNKEVSKESSSESDLGSDSDGTSESESDDDSDGEKPNDGISNYERWVNGREHNDSFEKEHPFRFLRKWIIS